MELPIVTKVQFFIDRKARWLLKNTLVCHGKVAVFLGICLEKLVEY